MMGLMVLGFFAVYLLVSIWVTSKAASWAKANNKKPWVWGGLAAFVMYNLVFWDLIPTLVMHKHYCDTQAGFWVYKTPEQWIRENPEVTAEDLKPLGMYKEERLVGFPYRKLSTNPSRKVLMMNQRIYLDTEYKADILEFIPMSKVVFFIADARNDYRLAELINFSSGYGNPMTTGKGLSAWKFWLRNNCYGTQVDFTKVTGYKDYLQKIIQLGELK